MAENLPLDPMSVLLLQVGELNGKADGIIRQLDTVIADNVVCRSDREDVWAEVGKLKSHQSRMSGIAYGAWTILVVALGYFGYHGFHQ